MRGHEVASKKSVHYPQGTIEMQFFKERGLDLSGFHRGTLNISGCSGDFEFAMLVFISHRFSGRPNTRPSISPFCVLVDFQGIRGTQD